LKENHAQRRLPQRFCRLRGRRFCGRPQQ
jgi:hypothetical protein